MKWWPPFFDAFSKPAPTPEKPVPSTEQVTAILEKSSTETLKRFKQELLAQNEELVERAIRKYRASVARRSWKVAQKWCSWSEDGPILLPDNTRMYYRRGKTEVMVQEFAPQIRHMKFVSSLALRSSTSDALKQEDAGKVCGYSLALPYMVFLYKFVDGIMDRTIVTFCDRPLKHLKEKPLRPFLSNINDELKLCHGHAFKTDELIKGNLTQQVAYTLNLFWQTVYSDEWSQNFWNYKGHFRAKDDQRLTSLENWQNASIENPLFIIDDVEWLPHSEVSYGNMVVRLIDHDPVDAQFQQELYNDLSEEFINEFKETLMKSFQEIETDLKLNFEPAATELINLH